MSCCVLNWQALTTMLPAFVIAGGITLFVSPTSVVRYLGAGAKKVWAYATASGAGMLLAVCSCNIVPLFNSIYRRGAGVGPAFAFLYAGPAINFVSTIFAIKVIGLGIGLYRLVMVPVIAVLTGAVMHLVFRREEQARTEQLTKLAVMAEAHHSPKQMGVFFALLMLILIVGATTLPKKIQFPNGVLIDNISEWGVRLGGIGMLLIPLAVVARRWLTRSELRLWGRETFAVAKTVVPILIPAVLAIAYLTLIIPVKPMQKWFHDNTVPATLMASTFGSLMYFPVLTEIAFAKAFLKMFSIGIGPALALLLTGPGLSLPGMLLVYRYIGWKKLVTYVLTVVVLSTAAGYLFGNVVGPYMCSCKLFREVSPGATAPIHEMELLGVRLFF